MVLGSITVLMGIATALYLSANGEVGKLLGSPLAANVPFFFTALLASAIVVASSGQGSHLAKLNSLPPGLLLTGVASAMMILGTTALVPRLGAGQFFVLLLAGQLMGALLVSHFGWFASPQQPLGWRALIGGGMVVVGAAVALWES